ncbi:7-cyano-7-deazaguanine synthase [archaeon]|nr:7-cyano-7-deazaguanine synthase [archaeon]
MIKAIAMMSGGLDSILAAKIIKDMGVDVIAVYFDTPVHSSQTGLKSAQKNCKKLGIPLKIVKTGKSYLRMIEKPKHGYGSAMNPCVDCRIYFLKKAREIAKKEGAQFIITGEVIGQRPMSQQMPQLKIVEKESGLEGKLLRPLSAKLLPPTEAEQQGSTDRSKLFDIRGRSRKRQMELAEKLGIKEYPTPAGGCLLTDNKFSAKLKDLLNHKKMLTERDYSLSKIGRHFRIGKNKIIVGRNKEENDSLVSLQNPKDYLFEVPVIGSPTSLLDGPKTEKAIRIAAKLTARYSDSKKELVQVNYGKNKTIKVKPILDSELKKLRV